MSVLPALFEHNRWANLRLIEACRTVPDEVLDAEVPGAYGPIRSTLLHLASAEQRYIGGLRGRPVEPRVHETLGFPGWDALAASLRETGSAALEYARTVKPGEVVRGRRQSGEAYEVPAQTLLLQVINHATEHRVNVTTALAARGLDAPALDGWAFGEEADSGR